MILRPDRRRDSGLTPAPYGGILVVVAGAAVARRVARPLAEDAEAP